MKSYLQKAIILQYQIVNARFRKQAKICFMDVLDNNELMIHFLTVQHCIEI